MGAFGRDFHPLPRSPRVRRVLFLIVPTGNHSAFIDLPALRS